MSGQRRRRWYGVECARGNLRLRQAFCRQLQVGSHFARRRLLRRIEQRHIQFVVGLFVEFIRFVFGKQQRILFGFVVRFLIWFLVRIVVIGLVLRVLVWQQLLGTVEQWIVRLLRKRTGKLCDDLRNRRPLRERQAQRLHASGLHLLLQRIPISLRRSVDVQPSGRLLLLCELLQLIKRIQ